MAWDEAAWVVNEIKKNSGGAIVPSQGPAFGSDGGSGLPPTDVSSFSAVPGDGEVKLSVTPTKNTSLSGSWGNSAFVPVVNNGGFKIVRKEGSAPRNFNDGVMIFDKTYEGWESAYKVDFTDRGLTNGKTYYYAVYPYSDHGVINYRRSNVVSAKPVEKGLYYGFHQNFNELDPSKSITYPADVVNSDFTPMSGTGGIANEGSWGNFLENVLQNHPYLVDRETAKAYKRIDFNDYTKFYDGTEVPSTHQFTYEYLIWLKKIYMKEIYAEDGNSRTVYFSTTPDEGFHPMGFTDGPAKLYEPEGIWIPMFPLANGRVESVSGSSNAEDYLHVGPLIQTFRTIGNITYRIYDMETTLAMDTKFLNVRTKYFPAGNSIANPGSRIYMTEPVVNLLRDLLYLLFKTSNLQAQLGSHKMVAGSTSVANKKGRFYGERELALNRSIHNKIFCSYAFGNLDSTMLGNIATFTKDGRVYFTYTSATNTYGNEVQKGEIIALDQTSSSLVQIMPRKLYYVNEYFGSVPLINANFNLGLNEFSMGYNSFNTTYNYNSIGLYNYVSNGKNGITSHNYAMGNAQSGSQSPYYVAPIVFPPAGYSPS